jgi:hypothetical protein
MVAGHLCVNLQIMPNRTGASGKPFHESLWLHDLDLLSPAAQDTAKKVLVQARSSLGAHAYHRASKGSAHSDRQTIFLHPKTGNVFLVVSVIRPNRKAQFSLRLDFFDKAEGITLSQFHVQRAPRTQWSKKGERRFFVPEHVNEEAVRNAVTLICQTAG